MKDMIYYKWTLLVALVTLLLTGLPANAYNQLTIPDVSVGQGATIALPVNLENDDQVAALQFTLTVPDGFTVNTAASSLTERRADHAMRISRIQGNDYLCMVYSPSNAALAGNRGTVVNIALTAPSQVTVGSSFPLTLSEAVASDKAMEDVLDSYLAGTITIAAGVDLVATSVTTNASSYQPGDHLILSWNVENTGAIATSGGWSEQLSLVDADGKLCVLGYVSHDGTLAGGATVARQAEVVIPNLHGLGDGIMPQVTIVPAASCGERAEATTNNTAQGTAIAIADRLYLELPSTTVLETSGQAIKCRVSRSGHWTGALDVALACSDERVNIATPVVIPAGQSGVYFYMSLIDNQLMDNEEQATVTASAQGYDTQQATITIEDDELPSLSATASVREIGEGGSFNITVGTDKVPRVDLTVHVACSLPARFNFPATVTIPAGSSSTTVEVIAVDDKTPDVDQEVTFALSADKHQPDEVWITLHDNDVPDVELTLTPTTVSESAGRNAVMATLKRLNHIDSDITFILSDDSNGLLQFASGQVSMAAGESQVQFAIGVKDNAIVDGDRTVNVTAAIYIKSCSCQAQGGSAGSVTRSLTVTDDDGPAISISSSKSTVAEGSETILTITRNAGVDQPLTVSLSSDNDEGLEYNHQVTIPAGDYSVMVRVSVQANDQSEDSRVVTLQAAAQGFSTATCWFMISNQTLPDAQIASFALSPREVLIGEELQATVTVTNTGSVALPSNVRTVLYMNDGTELTRMYTQQPLEPGAEVTMTKSVAAPERIGTHKVYAVVNDGKKVQELLTGNNTSEMVSLTIKSPFTTTLAVDKAVYQSGETITFTGTLIGNGVAQREVEIYLMCNGYRQTIAATTDANGHFTARYQPYSSQLGHFTAGACYPGENAKDEMTSFDIVGMERTSNSYLTCDVLLGEPYDKEIVIRNPSGIDLHNIKMNVISCPENFVLSSTPVGRLGAGETASVMLSVTGTAVTSVNEWEQAQVELVSDEGVNLALTLYLYCRNPQAQLKASIATINTTMVKGQSRDYPFYITNIGKGATGNITVALPDNEWMSLATPVNMASLDQNGTAQVVLRYTPTDDMPLNMPRRGSIAINCANGNGLTIPFSVEPVSESTGTLIVDVCDEYTYYTAQAPHVKGATVTIKHPTRGDVVAQGVTGEDGNFQAVIPEGYYALYVKADGHNSYSKYILVDPGRENRQVVNLTINAITLDWTVEPTGVQDVYDIVVNADYETNVPKPVVTISGPSRVDGGSLAVGESLLFYLTLTNHGLLDAQNTQLILPEGSAYWSYKALAYTEPFTLAPHQSVEIPVQLTRISFPNAMQLKWYDGQFVFDACMAGVKARYESFCEKVLISNEAAYAMAVDLCSYAAAMNDILSALSVLFEGVGIAEMDPYGPSGPQSDTTRPVDPEPERDPHPGEIDKERTICNPVLADCYKGILDQLREMATQLAPLYGAGMNLLDEIRGQYNTTQLRAPRVTISGLIEAYNRIRNIYETIRAILKYYQRFRSCLMIMNPDMPPLPDLSDLEKYLPESQEIPGGSDDDKFQDYSLKTILKGDVLGTNTGIAWADEFSNYLLQLTAYSQYMGNAFNEIYGDSVWLSEDDATIASFMEYASTLSDEDFNYEHLLSYKPECVSEQQLMDFILRLRNSESGSEDLQPQINVTELLRLIECCDSFNAYAQEDGFESLPEMFESKFNDFKAHMEEESNSVCSSVSMQLSQRLVLTRQAFRGTLTVYNGNDSIAMRDVKLMLTVTDEDGHLATNHEFQINPETLAGFEGEMALDAGWTLDAQQTGTATVLFIPTKYAAPIEEKVYYFGGTLSYVDPFTGFVVTRELYPQALTVRPSPDLELDYFLQRDIYGDDPLTEAIEPMVPAEFALLINNKGYGDAANVTVATAQPQITENKKGLLIDFSLLNGDRTDLGLDVSNNLGDIGAMSQAYAQWWLKSSLTGHFTSYDVSYTHVTSYGNSDLSLIDTVRVHELIHGFTAGEDGDKPLRGFLVNDMPDANDMPDLVHFTNATQENVALSSATISQLSDTEYLLTVTPGAPGWNYGWVLDPTLGRQQLVRIARQSDGATIYDDNVWATDRVLRDALDPLYEYRLHYIVEVDGAGETFVLTFEPRPDVELAVEYITGIPGQGEVLTEPLQSVTVTFNKAIDPSTFTTADLALTCQGTSLDASTIVITRMSDTSFALDLSSLTVDNGYYALTVQTSAIKDIDGYTGSTGRTVTWVQFTNAMVPLTIVAQPAHGGSVQPESGEFYFNSTVHLVAQAAPGYLFRNWTDVDGNTLSTEAEFDYPILDSSCIIAVFEPLRYTVTVTWDEQMGTVMNAVNHICDYGTALTMTATAAEGYEFDSWRINGRYWSSDSTLNVTVQSDMDIVAVFVKHDEPTATNPPVITWEVTENGVIITATGDGDVLLYVNGILVENPYYIPRGNEDVIIIASATAQAAGKPISETATVEVLIPSQENTGIDEMLAGKHTASVRYFNVAGQEMNGINGMTIVVITYDDGSVSTLKVR